MSKKVQVLLLENVSNVGQAGQIIETSEGYARNYLFPQGKAALATESVKKVVEQKKAVATKAAEEELSETQKKAEALEGTELVIIGKIKDGDQIFGKITPAKIAQELSKQAGLAIKSGDVKLPQVVNKLGTYDVTVRLSKEIETTLKVTVAADPSTEAKRDEKE